MSAAVGSAVQPDGLADILERVLDKGIVVAGDVSVSLVGIELLTIKLRLLVASVDKAKEMGINWWEHDPHLTSPSARSTAQPELEAENAALRARIDAIERRLASVTHAATREGHAR